MIQWGFTKQEAEATAKTVEEMFMAIPKTRRWGYLSLLNDVLLFLDAAKKHAPCDGSSDD